MKKFIFTLTAMAAVTACLDSEFREADSVLQVQDKVEVASDCESWEPVSAVLDVTSNRSWSAKISSDDASWVKVLTPTRANAGQVSECFALKLEFEDWDDPVNDRTAVLHITTENDSRDVTVIQKALVPRFKLLTPETYFGISEKGEIFYVRIQSNWNWTASLSEETDAVASIDCTGGYRDGLIRVTIDENKEDYPKSAYLNLVCNAAGTEQYTIVFHQNNANPTE